MSAGAADRATDFVAQVHTNPHRWIDGSLTEPIADTYTEEGLGGTQCSEEWECYEDRVKSRL